MIMITVTIITIITILTAIIMIRGRRPALEAQHLNCC